MAMLYAFITIFFVLFVNVVVWRKVMAVSLLVILFPDVANDYKLLCLFPGILMLIATKEKASRQGNILIIAALLMVPKQYYSIFDKISPSIFISPILLIILVQKVMSVPKAWNEAIRYFPAKLAWYKAGIENRNK